MPPITKLPTILAVFGAALIAAPHASAQGKVKVDVDRVNIELQKTPRFNVDGPKSKRDTQQQWVEVEVEFQANESGGDSNQEFIDALEFKYFITVTPKRPADREVYTLTVNHVNIPKGENLASAVYMSPNAIARIMGRNKLPSKADIDVAVEIRHGGTLVGGDATKSPSSRWWNSMPAAEGMVLHKSETPFAWLWSDRYAEVRK